MASMNYDFLEDAQDFSSTYLNQFEYFDGELNLGWNSEVGPEEPTFSGTAFDSERAYFSNDYSSSNYKNTILLSPYDGGVSADIPCPTVLESSLRSSPEKRAGPDINMVKDAFVLAQELSTSRNMARLKPTAMENALDDSLIIFNAKTGLSESPRKRRRFKENRRKEVASMRLVGVCLQCRMHREGCNLGMPCERCVKRAGSIDLGQQLCTRQNLIAARFGNIGLLQMTKLGESLRRNQRPFLPGTKIDVYLSHDSCEHGQFLRKEIRSNVQYFEPPPEFQQSVYREARQPMLVYGVPLMVADTFCAFPEHHLPSVDALIGCINQCSRGCDDMHQDSFSGMRRAFRLFVGRYMDLGENMPLHLLISKVNCLSNLFIIFRRACNMKFTPNRPEILHASWQMTLQIRHLVGQAAVSLEAEILNDVDSLTSSKGIGRQNPIAMWACLWSLLITYRELLMHIYYNSTKLSLVFDQLFGQAKHIYNTLTSIYAALFKMTSPLTMDWRTKEIYKMFGNDAELVELFCNIKTETTWFHAEKEMLPPEDRLLKKLVMENESKLMKAHIKEAKRRGFL